MKKIAIISIAPQYLNLIRAGVKQYELRRRPTRICSGDLLLVYATRPVCAIVSTFKSGNVISSSPSEVFLRVENRVGISRAEFQSYMKGSDFATAIEIAKYQELAKSVTLGQLRKSLGKQHCVPQSYRYLSSTEWWVLRQLIPEAVTVGNAL